jgi:hypothetical protein
MATNVYLLSHPYHRPSLDKKSAEWRKGEHAHWGNTHSSANLNEDGGEGGIRTPVPLTGQDAFEAPPLRPLRYLSAEGFWQNRTLHCS